MPSLLIDKGYGDTVDQIPIDQISISLFRETYPEKLFLTLTKHGHKIEENILAFIT